VEHKRRYFENVSVIFVHTIFKTPLPFITWTKTVETFHRIESYKQVKWAWKQVNDDRTFIFGWTMLLILRVRRLIVKVILALANSTNTTEEVNLFILTGIWLARECHMMILDSIKQKFSSTSKTGKIQCI